MGEDGVVSVDVWGQRRNLVRFDWGPTGAARIAEPGAVVVVVDVLSFTTTVGVAVERGMTVYPAAWRDSRATALAEQHEAELAVGRREAGPQRPWSLSPASIRSAPVTPRLILPSPNGSSIAAAASGVTVVAASLRNATLVGAWLARAIRDQERPIAVIAAGERWPDGTLRPALEDALGGGAVLSTLAAEIGDAELSPESQAARATYEGTRDPAAAVKTCASGIELIDAGFATDVDVAVEVGKGSCVPILIDGAFRQGS